MTLHSRSALGHAVGTAAPIVGFRSSNVTLTERADIGCVLVNAAVDACTVVEALSQAGLHVPLQAGAVMEAGACCSLWLTPRSWLVQCPIEQEVALIQMIDAAFPDKLVHAARFTDYLCWFQLAGARAGDLLTRGGFVSLEKGGMPVAHAKRTLIAGIAVVVFRKGAEQWLIGIERSRARYFSDWLSACSRG